MLLGAPAPIAAIILLSTQGLPADEGVTEIGKQDDGTGRAPVVAGGPAKALSREDLALVHTTSLKAGASASAPGLVEGVLDLSHAVPATSPGSGPGSFSFRNTPDLRSLRPPPPPWVHAGELTLPRIYDQSFVEPRPLELSPWALFAEKLDCRRAADSLYSGSDPDGMSLFYTAPPRETQVTRKVRKIVTERLFKELRRQVRRQWKDQFREHPSLSYAEYDRRLVQINNIGKDPAEQDYFNVEYSSNEFKDGILRKDRTDAESDLPLLNWGPVTVTDSGSVKFDVGTAANGDAEDATLDVGEERRKPLVGSKSYEVDTSIITDVNPFRGYTEGSSLAMVRRLGVEVKVDWLTDVLSRRVVSAEFECTGDLEGEYGVFVNFIIHSR